jgi:UTP-glucose-1-phosphate uridylyltransferase
MKVATGVIAAAGSGTRMLPVTLGYPKELCLLSTSLRSS